MSTLNFTAISITDSAQVGNFINYDNAEFEHENGVRYTRAQLDQQKIPAKHIRKVHIPVAAAPVAAAATPAPATPASAAVEVPAVGGPIIEYGLQMAKRGIRIHPLWPKTKLPILKEWETKATTDEATIRHWAAQYPGCNYGPVAYPDSDGIWLFESDDPSVLTRIEMETGNELPDTFRVESRPGRQHFYFKQNESSRRMGNLAQGFVYHGDFSVRQNKQFCVGPGSLHPVTGQPYKIVSASEIVEAPEWFITWLLDQKIQPKKATAPTTGADAEIRSGQRNATLASIAGKFRANGASHEIILAHLKETNATRCNPPLSEKEVEVIAESIARYKVGSADPIFLDGVPLDGSTTPAETTASAATAVQSKPFVGESLDIEWANRGRKRRRSWLWPNRIVKNYVTIFAGDPDKGKGTVAYDTIARLTTGKAFFDCPNPNPPIKVMILATEDSWEEDIIPRLEAAGANLANVCRCPRVAICSGQVNEKGEVIEAAKTERTLALERDVEMLRAKVRELGIGLVYIDPVESYLSGSHKNASEEMRALFDKLKKLAEDANIAILGVFHFNKTVGLSALQKIAGSVTIGAAVRLAWGFIPDTSHENEKVIVMSALKGNILKDDLKIGLSFKFRSVDVDIDGVKESYPAVEWIGKVSKTADELLADNNAKLMTSKDAPRMKEAMGLIQLGLPTCGFAPAFEIRRMLNNEGIPDGTVMRAREKLGVKSVKYLEHWFWIHPRLKTDLFFDRVKSPCENRNHATVEEAQKHWNDEPEYKFPTGMLPAKN